MSGCGSATAPTASPTTGWTTRSRSSPTSATTGSRSPSTTTTSTRSRRTWPAGSPRVADRLAELGLGVVDRDRRALPARPAGASTRRRCCDDDPPPRLDFLRRAVAIGADLGAEAVSFWAGVRPPGVDPDDRLATGWSTAAPSVVDAADERGVTLGFEPEPGMLVEDIAGWRRLRAALGAPAGVRHHPRHRTLPLPGADAGAGLRRRGRRAPGQRADRRHAPGRARAPRVRRPARSTSRRCCAPSPTPATAAWSPSSCPGTRTPRPTSPRGPWTSCGRRAGKELSMTLDELRAAADRTTGGWRDALSRVATEPGGDRPAVPAGRPQAAAASRCRTRRTGPPTRRPGRSCWPRCPPDRPRTSADRSTATATPPRSAPCCRRCRCCRSATAGVPLLHDALRTNDTRLVAAALGPVRRAPRRRRLAPGACSSACSWACRWPPSTASTSAPTPSWPRCSPGCAEERDRRRPRPMPADAAGPARPPHA